MLGYYLRHCEDVGNDFIIDLAALELGSGIALAFGKEAGQSWGQIFG